jgi:iron complex transport system permease protein
MDKSPRLLKIRFIITLFILISLTAIVSLISLSVGSSDLTLFNIFPKLISAGENDILKNILFEIRIPRILLAIAVGGGLSVAGAAFQSLLMNPLAEPYILGISSGGTFGALLAVILGLEFLFIQFFSFVGCGLIVLIVFMVSKKYGVIEPNSMILSGVMIGAFFSSLILVMVNFLDSSFRTAVFWLLGSLSMADKFSVFIVFIVVISLSLILILDSNKMNLLSLGDEQAFHLGINVKFSRAKIYLLSSLIVGSLVSVSGIIGFVGLIVPHATRLIFGSDNRLVVPYSFFVGAVFLLVSDIIARTIFSPAEIPIGAVTAFIGSPVFIYLLKRK